MLNTVRMQIGGIVCLALTSSAGDLKNVYALLPDAREPGEGAHGCHHPPHVAALQFYTDQLSPNNTLEPDLRFRRSKFGREQGIVFLVREDLEIEGAKNLDPPVVLHGRSNDYLPTNAAEERDLFWTSDLAALGVQGLQPGCVDTMDTMDAPPDSLLARFTLHGGVLSTGEVVRVASRPVQVHFFDRDNPNNIHKTYNQAISFWADWEARIPPNEKNEIGIFLTSFDNKKQRELLLTYAGLPSGGSLWLSLKNVTLSDLLELSDAIEPAVEAGTGASHFDLHYTIADPAPDTPWIPNLNRVTDGKPLCPPTLFKVEV